MKDIVTVLNLEPVATTCVSDPDDERDGVRFHLNDWAKLNALPAHTKLYTQDQLEAALASSHDNLTKESGKEADEPST